MCIRDSCTTDKARGTLKQLATKEGYETFVVPDDVGGRYSVLTAVGLLPIAVSGADIDALMQGAADAQAEYNLSLIHIFSGGVATHTIGKRPGHLDLSGAFLEGLPEEEKSIVVAAVVNTFIQNCYLDTLEITVDGEYITVNGTAYDYPMNFWSEG